MKFLNTYNEQCKHCNESIKQFLKPKSEQDILKSIEHLSDEEKFKKACEYGLTSIVKDLIDNGFDPSYDYNYGIKWSSRNGHLGVVKELLRDKRVDPSSGNNYAICFSSMIGYLDIVKLLLKDERITSKLSEEDLEKYQKQVEGINESIKQFLKPKSEENILKSIEHLSDGVKFEISCKFGLTSIVKYLIDNGFDPSYGNNYGITIASENGHLDVVKLLLNDKRVDPSEKYNHSIRWASRNGHLNVVKELLKDERVDPSYVDNYAIMYASHYDHLEIVKELLKDERVISKLSKKYLKKYQKQIEELNESIRDFLKPKSEQDILKTIEGLTPQEKLLKGCQFNLLWLVKQSLEEGADLDKHDICYVVFNKKPAEIAASFGNIDIIKYFLENNLIEPDYNLIHSASRGGHIDIVKYLFDDGRIKDKLTPQYLKYFTKVINGEINPRFN